MHGRTIAGMDATPNNTSTTRRPVRLGQLAKRLNCDPSTLWRWERAGQMPPRRQLVPGGTRIWFDDEIEAWLASRPRVCAQADAA